MISVKISPPSSSRFAPANSGGNKTRACLLKLPPELGGRGGKSEQFNAQINSNSPQNWGAGGAKANNSTLKLTQTPPRIWGAGGAKAIAIIPLSKSSST